MSAPIIKAEGLHKEYGKKPVLDNVSMDVPAGRIVGLIGPNGAGKTTFLKAVLGLIPYQGTLEVLGLDPHKQRTQLLEQVCFIADTAILPRWMRVSDLIDYVEGVHSQFNREKALNFLSQSTVTLTSKVGELSKGMTTQLHLALVMAIDAKLLVLDEPTLGLDIVHRKDFYSALLGEYFDHDKTIVITTHQVEEIEHILTDLVFIDQGKIILHEEMDVVPEKYVEVSVPEAQLDAARKHQPIYEQKTMGGANFIFAKAADVDYTALGNTKIPSISDLYLAKMKYQHRQQGGGES